MELGIDGAELDVVLTKDKKVVIFHDPDTERLCGVPGTIHERTLEEVSKLRIQKRLDYNTQGKFVDFEDEQPIALLEDLFLMVKGKDFLLDVELKVRMPEWEWRETGTVVAKLVREHGMENQCFFTSFDFFMLYELEKEYPGLQSAFQYDENMAKGLDEANEWFEKVPEAKADQKKFNANKKNFPRFVMEANVIGKLTNNTGAKFDYSVVDNDTIEKFLNRNYVVAIYVIYPRILKVHKVLTDEEQERIVDQLVKRKVNWMVTDEPVKLLAYLEKTKNPK